jgi:hypothetical protein
MRRLLASGLALALAVLAVTTFARTPEAQTADRVLEACAPGEETIDARALPAAVVTPERCPVAGREIEDGEVGSAVPPPGESVHAEVLTTTGAEELEVGRREDGTIELEFVGEDSEAAGEDFAKADGPGECSDPEYTLGERRLSSALRYRFNRATTPSELRPGDAADAIRRGGTRVANTKSNCRMGDRVPVGLVYEGKTGQGTNIDGLSCGDNDGNSVVAFGDLPGGVLAATCNWGRYDSTVASDVKINKQGVRWTTSPRSKSCQGRWDLEGVMTHERGHTFGMGHVSEMGHGNLTMSTNVNGPCQMAERSLGRGDVRGLGAKYSDATP